MALPDLAAAVIAQAVKDARGTGRRQESAAAFLASDEALGFWCAVAGVDERLIRERVAAVLPRADAA